MAVSRYTFRNVNLKRFALLLAAVTVVCVSVYAMHKLQVNKNASQMLTAAQNTRYSGNLNECLALYERYLNFRPRDVAVMSEYVNVLDEVVKGQPTPARRREFFDAYERLITMDAARIEDRRKLIDRYMALTGSTAYSRAIGHLEALLKADPNAVKDAKVMEQYALCAERLGQPVPAIERYRVAIETGNATSDAYLRLATLLQTSGTGTNSLDESKKLLDRLIAERPKDPAARLARAKYFLALKQRPQAINELQTAMSGSADAAKSMELVRLLAEMYREDNNLAGAREVISLAVTANPNDAALKLILSDLLARLNDPAGSIEQLKNALNVLPPDDLFALTILDRLIDRKDKDHIAFIHNEIRQRYGDRPNQQAYVDYLQGKLALVLGDWPAALSKLTKALPAFEKMPRLAARTHEALGHCYKAANNPDRMAACYRAALQADPLLDSAKLGLADANAILGDTAAALATFGTYADSTPEAKERLVRLLLEQQLGRPADRRNWTPFETALGRPPLSAPLDILNAVAQRAQGRKDDAVATLKTLAAKQPESLPVQLALVTLESESDTKAALVSIANLETKHGDIAELRLAKANVLAFAKVPAKPEEIAALAEDDSAIPQPKRFTLYLGLGDLLAGKLKSPATAVPLYRKAADAKPGDVVARSAAVDLLLALGREAEADPIIEELRNLEGSEGPSHLFCTVLRGAVNLKPKETSKLDYLRGKIAIVVNARPTWGRAALLAAELDDTAGDTDAALEKYRRAFQYGERQPKTMQRLVALLVARRRLDEARRVLTDAEQSVGLTDEMRRQGSLLEAAVERPGPSSEKIVAAAAESKSAGDHLFRGQWYLLGNKAKDAVPAFEKAIAIENASPDAWIGLLLAQTAVGDMAAANATGERARLALSNLEPATRCRVIGITREILGDAAEAEQHYKQGLTVNPNDAALLSQLAALYQRQNRNADAAGVYRMMLSLAVPDSVKRQARREIAFGLVARPDGFKNLNDAIALLNQNAPPTPDDTRMKGLVLSIDPFRRSEARKLLAEASVTGSAGQDDALRVMEFHLRDNELAKAEDSLKEAVRGNSAVPGALLATLHRLQMLQKKESDAKLTLERLLTVAPKNWETAVEMAREQAAAGDKSAALKLLRDHPMMTDPAKQLAFMVPALQDLGCGIEAEKLIQDIVQTTKVPNRHVTQVAFLLGANRSLDGLRAALAMPDGEYAAAVKARMLANAIASQHRAAIAAADQPVWDGLVNAAAAWLESQLVKDAKSEMLLILQGVIADARGQFDAAIDAFTKVNAINANSEMAANSLAYLLAVTSKDPAKANALTTALIDALGPRPHLLDTRAVARIALGQGAAAAADAAAASVQMPNKAIYWYRAAAAGDKAGDSGGRSLAFRKALQLGLKKEMLHPLEWPAYDKLKDAVIGQN